MSSAKQIDVNPHVKTLVLWALNLSDFSLGEDVEQTLNRGVKHPENPVLSPRPGRWDGSRCKVYGTVFYDEEDRVFKMWYSGGEDTPDVIRKEYGAYRHIGFAFSSDGVHWERPSLGLLEHNGSSDNNLVVLNAQAPNVLKHPEGLDLDCPYVMFTQAGQDTVKTRVLLSDDGMRWRVRKDNVIDSGAWGTKSHEPFSILHDPLDPDPERRWKGYSLVHIFRNGYRGRAVGFYFGATPFQWTEYERQPIFDTSLALESEIHIPHVTRFHDDYVMLYDAMEPWHDTQTEIAVSRDGINFERVRNGEPIVTRGLSGDHDAAKVCVSPHSLFVHEGKIWWYYTTSANNYQTCPRGGRGEPWFRYTCLAQWRQDGFAHLQARTGAKSAIVETISLKIVCGGELVVRLNAVSACPLRVGLLNELGEPPASGHAPAGDHLAADVVWDDGSAVVAPGATVRLRLHLDDTRTRLYSVTVVGAERAADSRPPRPAILSGDEPKPRWSFQAGDKITGTPLLSGDRVYVGSWDENMYCLDLQTGKPVWTFTVGNAIVAGACLTGNRLVFGSRDGNVYCIDADTGGELWRHAMGSAEDVLLTPNGPWVECQPAAAPYKPGSGDRVYVGSHNRRLAALNPETGSLCWEFPTFNWIFGKPQVVDYTVYFGSVDGWLYALDAACGALTWRYRTGEELVYAPTVIPGSVGTKAITASPLIHEPTIYIGGHDGFVHAVDRSSGMPVWTREIGRVLPSRAAICAGLLVVVANDGLLSALDPASGDIVWNKDLKTTVHADVVPHDETSFWVAQANGELLRFDSSGSLVEQIHTGRTIRATPTLTDGFDLLVATCRGELRRYALGQG